MASLEESMKEGWTNVQSAFKQFDLWWESQGSLGDALVSGYTGCAIWLYLHFGEYAPYLNVVRDGIQHFSTSWIVISALINIGVIFLSVEAALTLCGFFAACYIVISIEAYRTQSQEEASKKAAQQREWEEAKKQVSSLELSKVSGLLDTIYEEFANFTQRLDHYKAEHRSVHTALDVAVLNLRKEFNGLNSRFDTLKSALSTVQQTFANAISLTVDQRFLKQDGKIAAFERASLEKEKALQGEINALKMEGAALKTQLLELVESRLQADTEAIALREQYEAQLRTIQEKMDAQAAQWAKWQPALQLFMTQASIPEVLLPSSAAGTPIRRSATTAFSSPAGTPSRH